MNVSILKLVVIGIIVTLILAVAGVIWLSVTGHSIPDVLQNIAVGAITGLLGLLAPSKDAQNPNT